MKQLYAWWKAALYGYAPPQHDGMPECGFYKTRMVKGGPWVAVEICVEREIDTETGELAGPEQIVGVANGNPLTSVEIANFWTFLTPISREDFAALSARIAATPSMHNPYQKIDLINHGVTR